MHPWPMKGGTLIVVKATKGCREQHHPHLADIFKHFRVIFNNSIYKC